MSNESMIEWTPSQKLQRWMLAGTVAVLVDICLCAASLAIVLSQEQEPEGISVTDVLDGSVVIPQIVVLCAFLVMAQEVNSIGLWRSSIGLFGCLWLLAPLVFSSDEGWHWWDTALGLAVVAGAVCVFVFVVRRPAAFSPVKPPDTARPGAEPNEPASDATASENESKEKDDGHAGCGWGSAIAVALLVKVLLRGLRNVNVDWLEVFAVLLAGLLLCCLAVFSIWFGVAKIRLRDRLGKIAVVCGVADILSVFVYLSIIAYVSLVVIQLAMNEQEPDFGTPRLLIPMTVMSLIDILWKVLIAGLFLSVSSRGKTPWDREINDAGRYIDRR